MANEKQVGDVETKDSASFDPNEGKHRVATKRLFIAQWTLAGLGILLFFAMILLNCLDIENKREILSNLISSLFSAITLTIGFVAGSSIDNK